MEIGLEGIDLSFGKTLVLKNVSISLKDGETLVLLGSSGIGKTSLLRVMAGLERPEKGCVTGITKDTRISVLYQENRLFPSLTALENLLLVSDDREEIFQMALEVGLTEEELLRKPEHLSGGQKRRVSILRALLFKGDVFLMDEPSKGLDVETKNKVLEIIKRETDNKPLLVITHDQVEAECFGGRVIRLQEGGILHE